LISVDKRLTKRPRITYLTAIVTVWAIGFVFVVSWCFTLGPNCFVCEYSYFSNNDICHPDKTFHLLFQNHCPVTIFLGAAGPSRVNTVEGTWNLLPQESRKIVIPSDWTHTQGTHAVGPRFWARTGCKYDIEGNKAQCETGDCGNNYDCSRANLAGKAPTSLAEFCFICGDELTYYDVSLVDGYSISVDITPVSHTLSRPGDPGNKYWCQSTLCNPTVDLRTNCMNSFTLWNTNIKSYNPTDPITKIACFSNCGKFEYPTAPDIGCSDSDPQCKGWRMYCCQSFTYGKQCASDNDCNDGGACWGGTCQCKAYYRATNCPPDICTNPGLDAQPTPGQCPDCIGDDTLHYVCPRAYTWPNDPQTYSCDATSYIITFCPGGTNELISESSTVPFCKDLGPLFDWAKAQMDCAPSHGKYMCALAGIGAIWGCNVDNSGCKDVLCKWTPPNK